MSNCPHKSPKSIGGERFASFSRRDVWKDANVVISGRFSSENWLKVIAIIAFFDNLLRLSFVCLMEVDFRKGFVATLLCRADTFFFNVF